MLTNQQPVGDLKAKFAAVSKNTVKDKQPLLFDGVS
jgi:hypothetical protein